MTVYGKEPIGSCCAVHRVALVSVYDGAGRWLRYTCPLCEGDSNPIPTDVSPPTASAAWPQEAP